MIRCTLIVRYHLTLLHLNEREVLWQKKKCLNMNGCVAVKLLSCRSCIMGKAHPPPKDDTPDMPPNVRWRG